MRFWASVVATGLLVWGVSISVAGFGYSESVMGQPAPELESQGPWINSKPLTLKELRGKVVLIDIFEYTCVNCIRTIPYLRQWYKKYSPQGLVIIGVHDPEFDFTAVRENVRQGVMNLGIEWPVVLDNDHIIWNAYHNAYWPRKFLIDAKGIVRYDHIGEGGYENTEKEIIRLLREANSSFKAPKADMFYAREEDKPGAVCYPQTAETYANSERGLFAAPVFAGARNYKDSGKGLDGAVALKGKFNVTDVATFHASNTPGKFDDYVGLKFHASEVNTVFGYAPEAKPGSGYRVYVKIDDKNVPPDMKGEDLKYDRAGYSYIDVTDRRMYKVIGGKKYGAFVLKLHTDSEKFALYAYTFGSCLVPNDAG
ncbi:MAG: redoxin domain-containing protein [bacterium]